jgi:hypothetical protein
MLEVDKIKTKLDEIFKTTMFDLVFSDVVNLLVSI